MRAYLLSLEAGANGGTLNLMLQSDMGQISNVLKLAGGFALGLRFGAVTHVTVQETDPDSLWTFVTSTLVYAHLQRYSFTQISSLISPISPKVTRSFPVRHRQCQAVEVEIVEIGMCQLDMFFRQQNLDAHL